MKTETEIRRETAEEIFKELEENITFFGNKYEKIKEKYLTHSQDKLEQTTEKAFNTDLSTQVLSSAPDITHGCGKKFIHHQGYWICGELGDLCPSCLEKNKQ